MQVMKLSYFAHGLKMGLLGEGQPLSNEFVQAWKFGPVFPKIYHEFKYEPPGKIKHEAEDFNEDTGRLQIIESRFNNEELEVLDTVNKIYGDLDAWQLSELTHREGTPWHKAWKENGGERGIFGITIPNKNIAEHFKNEVIDKYSS